MRAARWFGSKSRAIVSTRAIDRVCLFADAVLVLVEVAYATGGPETYVLLDGLDSPSTARGLLDAFRGTSVQTEAGARLEFGPTHVLANVPRDRTEPVALMTAEQSNTSIRYGDALMLKLFRRLQFGPNPDVEVGWFLTEHSDFRGTPAVAGSLEYVCADGRSASLALLQEFVANRGDAWSTTLARLADVLQGADPDASLRSVARLGQTTADLHLALAAGSGEFASEPISTDDVAEWRRGIHLEVERAVQALASRDVLLDASGLLHRADGIDGLVGSPKIRHHGDYHLGQVLERQDGSFVIIDFEGEPARPLAQRREKHSPLRDVAGMLRSLDYARHAAVRACPTADTAVAESWYGRARVAFLDAYTSDIRAHHPALLPSDLASPLFALELEKAAYEVLYELNNRPDWLPIPLAAVRATQESH